MSTNQPHGFATSLPNTVSSTARAIGHASFGFTAEQLAKADAAIISATADMLWTEDGATDPVAATLLGHPLAAGVLLVVDGNRRLNNLRFVRKSADGVVVITLEKF